MALGEAAGGEVPAADAAHASGGVVGGQDDRPDDRLGGVAEERAAEQERRGEHRTGGDGARGVADLEVVRALGEQDDLHRPHGEVRQPEQDRVVVEGPGHRERGQQHRAHRGEHAESNVRRLDDARPWSRGEYLYAQADHNIGNGSRVGLG